MAMRQYFRETETEASFPDTQLMSSRATKQRRRLGGWDPGFEMVLLGQEDPGRLSSQDSVHRAEWLGQGDCRNCEVLCWPALDSSEN